MIHIKSANSIIHIVLQCEGSLSDIDAIAKFVSSILILNFLKIIQSRTRTLLGARGCNCKKVQEAAIDLLYVDMPQISKTDLTLTTTNSLEELKSISLHPEKQIMWHGWNISQILHNALSIYESFFFFSYSNLLINFFQQSK